MEQDVALAESIAVLQPPSKAGIIQKALDGLKRGLNINRGINSDGETEHWEERSDDSSGEPSDSTATAEKLGVASVTAAAAGEHLRVGKQRQKPTTNGSTALRSSGGCTTRGGDQEEEDGEEEDRDVFEMDGPGTGQGSQMRPAIRSFAEPSSAVGGRSAAPVFAAASGGDATIRSGTLERASSNRCVCVIASAHFISLLMSLLADPWKAVGPYGQRSQREGQTNKPLTSPGGYSGPTETPKRTLVPRVYCNFCLHWFALKHKFSYL